MDQAKNWQEFRAACSYSNIPGENMIWADINGDIGWQAVGIAPIRKNFSGLVPILGNGKYEWSGYLPIIEKPNIFNPEKGFIATANQNLTPFNFKNWDAIGFTWSDPFRGDRINNFLGLNDNLTIKDMKQLQVDVTSLPAKTLVPYLEKISFNHFETQQKNRLLNWDFRLRPNSVEAAIYVAWENEIMNCAFDMFVPNSAKSIFTSLQLKTIIDWIKSPGKIFSNNKKRDVFLKKTFTSAILNLKGRLGEDTKNWIYGQKNNKHTYIIHSLGEVSKKEVSEKLNLGPLPRGGNSYTPASTGSDYRQTSGGSFRIIVNTGDWDSSIGTNAPGQSGNPESPFYGNLFKDWAEDKYFPIYFSKEKIESATFKKTILYSN